MKIQELNDLNFENMRAISLTGVLLVCDEFSWIEDGAEAPKILISKTEAEKIKFITKNLPVVLGRMISHRSKCIIVGMVVRTEEIPFSYVISNISEIKIADHNLVESHIF